MPLEVDNDGYHSLTEMFSIIHPFFLFGKKNYQIIHLYQTNNKRQHFFVENMLEMWKQNAIRKVALTFRLLLYHNILNLQLHLYIYIYILVRFHLLFVYSLIGDKFDLLLLEVIS